MVGERGRFLSLLGAAARRALRGSLVLRLAEARMLLGEGEVAAAVRESALLAASEVTGG